MTITELTGILALLILVVGCVLGFLKLIKNTITTAINPINVKIDSIDKKMVSRKSVQTILSMQTREIVGMKRKIMPTINAFKTFLVSKGITIKPKSGEYIGDLSKLYDLPEDDFINEIRIILDKDNEE